VIAYNVTHDKVELDTSARFELFTPDDIAYAVITGDNELQLPNPKKHINQVVTLTF